MPRASQLRAELQTRIQRFWMSYQKRNTLGARGERAAAKYLRKQRYHIAATQARNVYGEIDIIAVDHKTVVFVEVKTRKSESAGHPAEAVTQDKQRRIARSALAFLKHHNLLQASARFDVVAVIWPSHVARPEILHYKHAFTPLDSFQLYS